MKSPLITLFTGLVLAVPMLAYAHHPGGPRHPGPRLEGCENLKLTDAQKAQLRDAHLKFEDERIDLEAKERHARLELRKLLASKDADAKSIRKAAQTAAEAAAQIQISEEVQRTEVLLSVFKPEQREMALHCGPGHRPGHHEDDDQGE